MRPNRSTSAPPRQGARFATGLVLAVASVGAAAQVPVLIQASVTDEDAPAGPPMFPGETPIDEQAPEVPPGWVIVEGDILMPAEALRGTHATNLWPGGVVPFEFASSVSVEHRENMLAAMSRWELAANVDFVPRSGQFDFVRIQNSTVGENNSAIGRVGGQQLINIDNWGSQRTLKHELGHCLGFYHEHSRPDRETYVEIHLDRICTDCCGGFPCHLNFLLEPFSHTYGPYDFESIMHYRQCTFSACDDCSGDLSACRTIAVRPPYTDEWQDVIGTLSRISDWDARVMSFLYPDSGWRFVRDGGNDVLNDGTYLSPWETFSHGYAQTPAGGRLWALESRTITEFSILDRPMSIACGRGSIVFR